ncbi:MAG: hypothetical protein ACKV2V_26890 [Blastocatellia bacterium]
MPYLVMELLDGEEPRAQMNAGALLVKRAIEAVAWRHGNVILRGGPAAPRSGEMTRLAGVGATSTGMSAENRGQH